LAVGNTAGKNVIYTGVLAIFHMPRRWALMTLMCMLALPAWGLPLQPNIKLLLDEANRTPARYVPARAGWNGPEEKPARAAINPGYERLMHESSPAEVRQQLFNAAVPDWRVLLLIATVVITLRASTATHKRETSRTAKVLSFPILASEPEPNTGSPRAA